MQKYPVDPQETPRPALGNPLPWRRMERAMRDSVITAALLLAAGLLFAPFRPASGELAHTQESVAHAAAARTGTDRNAEQLLLDLSSATANLAGRVLEATVHFEASRDGDSGRTQGTGTGFVIDAARGLAVTNFHVVGSKDAVVRVRLQDGRKYEALVLGTDPSTDLAVVQFEEGVADAQLAWGDSDTLVPGVWIMAVGNPLGELGTTSTGVISGLNRTPNLPGISYENFLQFDAYIDRGSSGGPLVNMRGEVIGVNTAIAGQVWQGAGYAVPSRMARSIVESLIENQRVLRGYLGVTPRAVNPSDAEQVGLSRPYGARVASVTDGSPAEEAGLRRGDIILSIDGKEVASHDDLRARVSTTRPGSVIRLKIWRDRGPMTVKVKLGELGSASN